jgi:hypothetical protein
MKDIHGQPNYLTREVALRLNIKFNTFKNMLSNKGIFTGMYPTTQWEKWFTISQDYVPQTKKYYPTTYWSERTIKKICEEFKIPFLQLNPIEPDPVDPEPSPEVLVQIQTQIHSDTGCEGCEFNSPVHIPIDWAPPDEEKCKNLCNNCGQPICGEHDCVLIQDDDGNDFYVDNF